MLKAATAIIREDNLVCLIILCTPHRVECSRIYTDIPDSQSYFLEQVILKNKRHNLEHLKLVCTNISHKTPSQQIVEQAYRENHVKKRGQVYYPIGGVVMCAYHVECNSFNFQNDDILGMVILREKSIRKIFVDNFMIYNFYLSYIFDKTYRFQEKLKKSENFDFYLE